MASYLYKNPKTGEIIEVIQNMNDVHEYEENGVKFKRVFTKPGAAFDTIAIDPFSAKDFNRVTNKNGLVSDLWERSAELSEKRKDKEGRDNIKEKFYDDYKSRKKREHPSRKREKALKKLNDAGISVDLGD